MTGEDGIVTEPLLSRIRESVIGAASVASVIRRVKRSKLNIEWEAALGVPRDERVRELIAWAAALDATAEVRRGRDPLAARFESVDALRLRAAVR